MKLMVRASLERELEQELLLTDRHPTVTLTGYGGIGKTSLALHVIHNLLNGGEDRFQVVIWFSARDIDLLAAGPKVVQPHGISIADFAAEYVRLVEPQGWKDRKFQPLQFFRNELTRAEVGPVLFVFDNFETTANPTEVFSLLDQYVRLPNKILITSRNRHFTGDYAVHVGGMTEEECWQLIEETAKSLGIKAFITDEYVEEVIKESNGHPYIIKLLLGEVAKSQRPMKVERVVASQEQALTALFERSYNSLTPAA